MPVPVNQIVRVGAYVVKQHLLGRRRYPLVLMLEPLFRCNLACAGCGKIDYPAEILNQRLSVQDCLEAVDSCGAPVVAIAGGEPLLHKELPEIVGQILGRGKFVYLCTNGLLLEKKLDLYQPHPNFAWDIHLDGDREMHDRAVSQDGTYDRAVAAINAAKVRGFRVCINTTLFDGAKPERVAAFLDDMTAIGIDGVMISPGYAYERAPDRAHFLNRQNSKQLFRDIFRAGRGHGWKFNQSSLFLDFLAGNQRYLCTPWGKPTRNVFGWQRPCYLLGEGFAKTYAELMATTDWDKVRHRQLREMRRLHGAFRLRGDRGGRCGAQALEDAAGGVARPAHRRRHGAGNFPRGPAPGRIRVQPPCAARHGVARAPAPPRGCARGKTGGGSRRLISRPGHAVAAPPARRRRRGRGR